MKAQQRCSYPIPLHLTLLHTPPPTRAPAQTEPDSELLSKLAWRGFGRVVRVCDRAFFKRDRQTQLRIPGAAVVRAYSPTEGVDYFRPRLRPSCREWEIRWCAPSPSHWPLAPQESPQGLPGSPSGFLLRGSLACKRWAVPQEIATAPAIAGNRNGSVLRTVGLVYTKAVECNARIPSEQVVNSIPITMLFSGVSLF